MGAQAAQAKWERGWQLPLTSRPRGDAAGIEVFCSVSSPRFCVQSKLEAFHDDSLKEHFVVLVRLHDNLGVCFNFIVLKFYCILLNCFSFIVNETKSTFCNGLKSRIFKEER